MRKGKIIVVLALMAFMFSGCDGHSDLGNDEVLQSMTLTEKVGQLFVICPELLYDTMRGHYETELTSDMKEALSQYPAGGFILYGGNIISPDQLLKFTADLKEACDIMPLMAIDEEGGTVARIARNASFDIENVGSMIDIGSTGDPENAYNAGATIGEYISYYGFNMDFAPVADIKIDPDNAVTKSRSFGDDPELVSKMVGAFLDALHSQNIAGSVKHFPGHGAATNDTHLGYSAVYKTWEELLQMEVIPFRENFSKADSIMIGHLSLVNVTSDDLPASLSYELITGKLRNELGYDGVILSDALNMGAILESYTAGEAAVMAFLAGNDILLMPSDYYEAFNAVYKAVESGKISESRLNESVRRILALKRRLH